MRNRWRWLMVLALLAASVSPLAPALAALPPQADTPETRARALLSTLSPEERVGQLFLVTFDGVAVEPDAPIYDLVFNHYVGGVVLRAENGNFAPPPDTVDRLYQLTADLQTLAWESSLENRLDAETGQTRRTTYIPLWIGVQQTGGGPPWDAILSGLSQQPPQMALGASWDLDLTRQSAQVVGRELSALGINLFFGPSLDVLSDPNVARLGDPGVGVFGGDPFWVGRLGQAYVDGLHTGSQGQLLVVPGAFPGMGVIDRDPQVDIPVVRRSLEQLQQVELAPFAAVTGGAASEIAQADGLLVSHIRYQGFQGNIRLTTRPVSLDAASLSAILDLPAFADWRENGGLIVCNALDTQAVRRFYDPTGLEFNPALVARDAFLAGNDLIYLGDIQSGGQSVYETVLEVLDFFVQKYHTDPVFASQVDAAALRILTAKYRLYPTFVYNDVVPPVNRLRTVGDSNLIAQIAREAATLISPDVQTLDDVLGGGPGAREHIVFITEPQVWRQCASCPAQVVLGKDDLARAVKRLYGSSAGGPIYSAYLHSYTFADLDALGAGQNVDLEADLRRARWIVLAATDLRPTADAYRQLQVLLAGRPDLLREKRVVMFNFGAPYALDTTDISRLTAYYGLYTPQPTFVETAVRLLFQEFIPSGDLPVSVPAVGYDILAMTAPDPEQLISLSLDLPVSVTATPPGSDSAIAPVPSLKLGDTVTVRTDPIKDHNGHIVPDGTVVTFFIVRRGEDGNILQQVQAETRNGVALTSLRLENSGLLEISAASEPAFKSVKVLFDVSDSGQTQIIVVTPTPAAQPPTPLPRATATDVVAEAGPETAASLWSVWWQSFLFLVLGGWVVYQLESLQTGARWGARRALAFVVGGLAVINGVFWGRPQLALQGGRILALMAAGAAAGWLLAALWRLLSESKSPGD